MAANLTVATKFTAVDKFSSKVAKMQKATGSFTSKATAGFAKIERGARRVAMASQGLTSKLFNLRNAAGVMAAGFAVKKTFDMAVSVAKIGDEAAKTSRRLGVSAEFLQEFQFAADRAGVSGEETVKSFEKLSRNVGDLKAGTGTLTTLLKKTNPELLKQLQAAKSNEEAFALVTNAVNKLPTQMEKASLSQAAFGRSGLKMLTVMEGGMDGINKLREEARKYGGVISNEMAAKSEEFIDKQTNMNFALKGLTNTIGVALMPKVQEIMEKITAWVGANRELINTKVTEFATRLGNGLMWLANNIGTIITVAKMFIGTLIFLKSVTMAATMAQYAARAATFAYNVALGVTGALSKTAAIGIGKSTVAIRAYKIATTIATVAQRALNFAMKMNPIGIIIMAIIALIAVIKNWGKIWDWIKKQWNKFWIPFKKKVLIVAELFKRVWAKVKAIWQKLTGWITKLWDKAWGFVKRQAMFLIKIFITVRDFIQRIWEKVTGWISDKWDKLWGGAKRIFMKFIDFFRGIARAIREIWNSVVEWITTTFFELNKKLLQLKADYLGDQTAKMQLKIMELGQKELARNEAGQQSPVANTQAAQTQAMTATTTRNINKTTQNELVIKDETGRAQLNGKQTSNLKLTKTMGL